MKWQLRFWLAVFLLLFFLAWSVSAPSEEAQAPREEPTTPPRQESPQEEERLRVKLGGEVRELSMEEYLLGVLRAEMPAVFETEALKAQAIAARSYTYYKMAAGEIAAHPEADACDDITCCKAFKDAESAAQDWGSMALYYEEKLARAVEETKGEVLVYGGEPVLAVFFSSSGGRTQRAADVWQEDVPYLQSVPSAEEEEVLAAEESAVHFTAAQFRAAVLERWPAAQLGDDGRSYITDIVRNEAGYVTSLTVGGVPLKGNELRMALGLRSPHFTVAAERENLTFRVVGYGHGVGMSQYGANAMAKAGADAKEILEHYFVGARVEQRE